MGSPASSGLARAALVFAVSFLVYALLLQTQPYGDGISYLVWLRDGNFLAHHLLYLPDLRLFVEVLRLFGAGERAAAFLFQAFCAALGNGFLCYLLATSRKLAPGCTCPIRLAALVGLTPVILFYATTVENHAHHYAWICLMLCALDRALARGTAGAWVTAGLALLGCYGSHSSVVLLLPGLVLAIRRARGIPALARPGRVETRDLGLFFAPALALRLAEPWIQARLLGGGDAWLHDAQLDFVLSLLAPHSAGVWADYLVHELFLPAVGLWWAFLVLALRRLRAHGPDLAVGLVALLPYVLVFGHWSVREFGAYYVAFFPLLAVLLGRLMPALRREEAIVLLILIAGQAGWGAWRAATWVGRQERPDWAWADAAARVAGRRGTVLTWSGSRALHVDYDHGIEAQPFENWWLQWKSGLTADPKLIEKIAAEQMPRFVDGWLRKGGVLVVSGELWNRLAEVAALRPIRAELARDFDLVSVHEEAFDGFRVERK